MNDDNNIEKGIISSEQPQIFSTAAEEETKDIETFCIISLVFSGIRIAASVLIYFGVFLFGTGPWAEGRVFGYITGVLNCPCMIVVLILNLIARTKNRKMCNKKAKRLIDWAWLGLLIVLIFTFLIFSYRP